ncbi:hypothetical protein PGH07_00205 [Sulfurovum sp. zt1-1]|uniref:ATRX ADD domain-containing protein n=1 Tax=Sulfurovum zhangzhouensis TaxID=3019067 RepID=A0ABT7QUT5_9BACT|nr:hypothetical protein [Sulfurovum zhangzhouensis]MDM5270593.1 hypothetical protein [Sulfurovum zhangzhouensis]
MKKICLSSYLKYLLITVAIVTHIFIVSQLKSISAEETIIAFSSILIWGVLGSFIKCTKCNKEVFITKDGVANPFRTYICDKCGQNLMKCDIEYDEVTSKRLS